MINVNKLKGKIVECGLSVDELAEKIGLDKSTLYRRLHKNGETFSIREANLICEALSLTKEEATAIFFTNFVA